MNPYADLLESKDASPVAKKRKLDSAPGTATLPIIEEPSSTTTKAPECPVVPAEGIRKDPAAKRPVDVSEALSKLKSFLSNAKKVTKAVSMIRQLTENKMTADNLPLFLEVWDAYPLSTVCPKDTAYFSDMCEISRVASDRAERCSALQKEHRFRIETFRLATVTRQQLHTDDTVQFTKSCRDIQFIVEALFSPDTESSEDVNSSLYETRNAVILTCMSDAFKLYKRLWAKQPIDLLFRAAAVKRRCFKDAQLEALDELTQTITIEQRASSANVGPRTIRTYDSTAHPLRQKNIGILR